VDTVENLADEDVSGKRGDQEREDEYRDEMVLQEIIFQTEVEESEKRHEEEKRENNGKPIVEPFAFQGEVKHLLLEIHVGSPVNTFDKPHVNCNRSGWEKTENLRGGRDSIVAAGNGSQRFGMENDHDDRQPCTPGDGGL
jgi:hypothetical protein